MSAARAQTAAKVFDTSAGRPGPLLLAVLVVLACLPALAQPARASGPPPAPIAAAAVDAGTERTVEPLSLDRQVIPQTVRLGDPFVYRVTVHHPAKERWELRTPRDLGGYELIEQSRTRSDGKTESTTTYLLKMALFELGVLLDGVAVDRAHRIQLTGHLLDDFAEPCFVERGVVFGGCGLAVATLFDLGPECFGKSVAVRSKLAQIDLIASRHVLGEAFNLELNLSLADFLFASRLVQIAERLATAAQIALHVVDLREARSARGGDFRYRRFGTRKRPAVLRDGVFGRDRFCALLFAAIMVTRDVRPT